LGSHNNCQGAIVTSPETDEDPAVIARIQRQAMADAAPVTTFAQELIRIPSRGGIDDPEPILALAENWLRSNELPHRRLHAPDGAPAAVVIEVAGARPGPTWVLDACLDTAPFGDETAWSFSPTAGDMSPRGMLRGRGAADSKTAAAMFCHLAAAISRQYLDLAGTLVVLLDVDEHTGNFSGAKALLQTIDPSTIAGALIGYPGHDEVTIGGRGVFRARLHVHGTAEHSGSTTNPVNAAIRAAQLAILLDDFPLPELAAGGFPLPPKLTVTEIHSGTGFTTVPDHAVVAVDIRLTDVLGATDARELINKAVAELDADHSTSRPTKIEPVLSWPHYQLSPTKQPAAALIHGATTAGFDVTPKVAGPSNIGNLFATHNIPATAGFGVPYTGLHGTDEQADLNALPAVQAAYHLAVLSLMNSQH
jgi:succinyl-diaminopimelate desuccinylase